MVLHRLSIMCLNIFFPPLAVALLTGIGSRETLLNSCLFLLAVIPSHVHGFIVSWQFFKEKRRVKKRDKMQKSKGEEEKRIRKLKGRDRSQSRDRRSKIKSGSRRWERKDVGETVIEEYGVYDGSERRGNIQRLERDHADRYVYGSEIGNDDRGQMIVYHEHERRPDLPARPRTYVYEHTYRAR